MKTVAFTNHKEHAVHIGNKMVMPGDTREVEATLLPDYEPPEQAAAKPNMPLAEQLSEGKASDARAAIATLSDDDLQALADLEMNKKNQRSSVIEAIAKEQFKRAQLDGIDADTHEFEKSLRTQSDDMLHELAELHRDDEALLSLINAEIAKREADE